MIRLLKAEEIDCRVGMMKPNGCSLLLYKDARVDMNILDEVFGSENWQRTHEVIKDNLFCNVDILVNDKWIRKQDVGTKSMTEKEKGEASDSFKRACVNVGIGRELYSAPFIWINLLPDETYEKDGKTKMKAGIKFKVKEIGCDDSRSINHLVIEDNKHTVRFTTKFIKDMKDSSTKKISSVQAEIIDKLCDSKGVDKAKVLGEYSINSFDEMTNQNYSDALHRLKNKPDKVMK
jgi:hypothetical protein